MNKMHGGLTGLFALVAGVFLYMGGAMYTQYAGILLALFGLSFTVHKLGMCPTEGNK